MGGVKVTRGALMSGIGALIKKSTLGVGLPSLQSCKKETPAVYKPSSL